MVLIVLYLFCLKLNKVDTYFGVRLLTVSVAQGATPYYGLYGEVPHKRGTFFRLQVYERVGVYQLKYIKG